MRVAEYIISTPVQRQYQYQKERQNQYYRFHRKIENQHKVEYKVQI